MRDKDTLTEITSEDTRETRSGRLIADSASAVKSPPVIPNLPLGAKLVSASSLRSPGEKNAPRDYSHSPLIYRVCVHPWPQKYNFYQRFCYDAERFFAVRGQECPRADYFSYIPQYAQLSADQMRWYLWFRERVRHGEYPDDVDFPYILLLIYEIINLPHKLPPEKGAQQLSGIWLAYRRLHPELDKYLSEWMCDYCLVHEISLPQSLQEILPAIIRRTSFKEFYIASLPSQGEEIALSPKSLIAAASDYSYTSSRYYADNKEAFDTFIPKAVAYAANAAGISPTPSTMRRAKTERDAFCGSLCAQTVKRRIVVEYYSFARSYEMRSHITAAVKTAENLLRRSLKIKSRLAVANADTEIVRRVQAYAASALALDRTLKKTAEDTSYERYYDAPTTGIDFALSHKIEEESWENTARLTEETEEIAPALEVLPASTPAGETAEEDISPAMRDLLTALLQGESLTAWCRRQTTRQDPQNLADALNEMAADRIGDIILQSDGDSWTLIEDYREDIASWITLPPN